MNTIRLIVSILLVTIVSDLLCVKTTRNTNTSTNHRHHRKPSSTYTPSRHIIYTTAQLHEKGTLAQCGMEHIELGFTYLADRIGESGNPIQSSLDHIYRSVELEEVSQCCKLSDSSTDHVPIKILILKYFEFI